MILKTLRIIAGVIVFLFGVIGGILPVIPGTPFMIAGIILIAPSQKEKIFGLLHKAKQYLLNIFGKKKIPEE